MMKRFKLSPLSKLEGYTIHPLNNQCNPLFTGVVNAEEKLRDHTSQFTFASHLYSPNNTASIFNFAFVINITFVP